MPDAALSLVRTTGVVYFLDKDGCVVDFEGVGGTGRTKTLIFASSPAVK